MSSQLKAFLEAVKADEILQEKIKAAGDANAAVAIAKAAGFTISAEEFQNAQELSEDELAGLAGGGILSSAESLTSGISIGGVENAVSGKAQNLGL